MRVAYFDCFSGISGNMALAALVHAGADLDAISQAIAALPVEGFDLERQAVDVQGIAATRLHLSWQPQEVIRTYASIRALLEESDLPASPLRTAQRMYRRLAEAAARAYAKEIELVTFHEFGDLDCMVDFVGCALALDQLGVERVFASPIPTGLGMARTEHGLTPVPGPVVLELLRGAPTYSRGIPVELVTPTGAAILAAISEGYGDMPMMRVDRVGYGAGQPRIGFPNAVRVVVGVGSSSTTGGPPSAAKVMVEATVPGDSDPPRREALLARLFGAGADDAWITFAVGRGGLPRATISAVVPRERTDEIAAALRSEPGAVDVRIIAVSMPTGEDADRA
jgi:pyridinium-3,5-bisthiocarboxylic acid mononucleotide nickel chelatase